ncbi:glycosyltransferase family 39 protein [Hymenobacter sp. BT635]|uniref:Glycosyltransferase family 39 protein n=1 Tax=Hymenobacter nitidus TaxID=2880929 RepID=A0ABS8AIN0_9BACT|nr:glycosyltransferase family 39 protein [Hymenobacter nitidus]MCB2379716.1 glycosyltransferase family 39 protein [Hymenobacter nitidus]
MMEVGTRSNQRTIKENERQADRPGLRTSLRSTWQSVWPLLAVGLVLRLLFLAFGAEIYYSSRQSDIYSNGDSYSYVLSFHNLLEHGRYTFDLTEPEAAVGRLPGYPFFYGAHFLVFGQQKVLFATACTQVLLDTLGIWLIYVITARLSSPTSWAPFLAALLLTLYPFSIVWVTITGTETLGLFLVLLWWAALLLMRPRALNWVLLGVLLAVILYVREFLGVCVAVTMLYLLIGSDKKDLRTIAHPIVLVLAGFLSLYIWWPVRNYMVLGRLIPLKPAAAGYANLQEDAQTALAWMLTWTNDVTMGFDEIMFAEKPSFPEHVINTPAEKQLIDSLVTLSRTCASSFHVRMLLLRGSTSETDASAGAGFNHYQKAQQVNTLRHHNCNDVVSAGFNRLRASYIHRHPIRARVEVPLLNFQKILFKSQFKPISGEKITRAQQLTSVLFMWRSVLLALGFIGAWRYRKLPGLWPALMFAAVIFGYMAIVFRTMEMRYLLQADVFMLVPAALLLASWVPQRWAKSVRSVATA